VSKVAELIASGVNVNAPNLNDDGWTALHYAAHEGLDDMVEQIIRKFGANVD
jgi:ankyrin repeat protein